MNIYAECPYCGFENKIKIEPEFYYPKQVVTCDIDEGGCEKDFVVDIEISIFTESLKIEGEE